ncbi:MAG: ABATE domain-containing protein [Acidobacteriota bacterium]
MNDDDLPILGEAAPIELANSLYLTEEEAIDFLADDAAARRWFRVAELDQGPWPSRTKAGEHRRLVALRNAIKALLKAAETATVPPRSAVDEVNRCARLSPVVAQLSWPRDEEPTAKVRFEQSGVAGLLARLAVATIELLSSDDVDRLRRCEGPGCSMMFLQHHRRRRFCHESCSHRARQMRYYRRTRGTA